MLISFISALFVDVYMYSCTPRLEFLLFLESNTMPFQSLFSPFFEFLIGVEIKREKRKCRITCAHSKQTKYK